MKMPAFQFYPADWMKDPNLRRCTHAAKGVWIDILCLMSECEERGVLKTNGHVWDDQEIALAVGGDQQLVLSCIVELTLKGVSNRREDGALICRRMVRDENKRKLCAEAGKRGGNPNLGATFKGVHKGVPKGVPKRKPTPSTSSSTSVFNQETFDQFWSEYPKKKAKANAEKAWAKVAVGIDVILAAVRSQKYGEDWRRDGGKWIPLPASWLNARRWEDEGAEVEIRPVVTTTAAPREDRLEDPMEKLVRETLDAAG